jgi:hypothetical protein
MKTSRPDEEHTMFDIAQETIQYGKLWSGWEGDGIPKFYSSATVTGGRPEQLALFLEDKGHPVETLSVLGPRTRYVFLAFDQKLKRIRLPFTRQISIILAKLHACGFDHADLAARNVLRGVNEKISVIDFAELRPTAQKSEGGG